MKRLKDLKTTKTGKVNQKLLEEILIQGNCEYRYLRRHNKFIENDEWEPLTPEKLNYIDFQGKNQTGKNEAGNIVLTNGNIAYEFRDKPETIKVKVTLMEKEHKKVGKSFYDKLCDNALILDWVYHVDSRTLEIEIEEKNLIVTTQQVNKIIEELK